jgi:NAD(P)-dependent dehydrogenase (short-subunit alcohol dehydrogenase family)
MRDLNGKVAAVTGAGSGIGRATAIELAKAGCHVAISDIAPEGLEKTAESCRAHGVNVTTAGLDVADRDAIYAWAEQVVADHGGVNIVVNNAGVALTAPVAEMTDESFEWLFAINFWGVVHGTRAFLPHLRAAGEAHVVNISSLFGLVGIPTQSAYCAAKFAVRGFTESLRMELAGTGVGVTSVHPGGIRTNIARAARFEGTGSIGGARSQEEAAAAFDKVARTSPARAAKRIVLAIRKDRGRLPIGLDAYALALLQRVAPAGYQRFVVTGARVRRS